MAIDEELHGIQFKSGLSHIFYGNVTWQGFLKTAVIQKNIFTKIHSISIQLKP
jgi:hypothetical protein